MESYYSYVGTYVEKNLELQELIFNAIESALEIDSRSIQSSSRKRDVVEARHIFMYLMAERTHKSLEKIGKIVNRAHSSVIHAKKQTEALIITNKDFRSKYYMIINRLENSLGHQIEPSSGFSTTSDTVKTFSIKMEKLHNLQTQINNY